MFSRLTAAVISQLHSLFPIYYSLFSTHETSEKRRKALNKALKAYGYSSLIKKLNAVRLLTRNTSPGNSKIYDSDIKYLQNLNPKKSGRKSKRRRS